jgi:hypothetical protein
MTIGKAGNKKPVRKSPEEGSLTIAFTVIPQCNCPPIPVIP